MGKYIKPNYQKIYNDLIARKYPDKKEKCSTILAKKDLSAMDIIKLNKLIFTKEQMNNHLISNQKHRSYDKQTILQILKYQQDNNMNNSELARHFCLSRNSVAKWRKIFLKEESSGRYAVE
ncbi:MAG: helix-turn-helix domain-containing protein [Chryseobacterium sp.]|jgi:DNA-binding transcriptional regulator YiaG|uniref:helix-turn-helix domain-containing protein n=1 Tax=Chryseobacterium sp. TaxID=1871047 RepID=UPI0028306FD3|nr:helix-turn-helix domain-containing protein [Chryseobacterium sp.]MDR2234722.1 helix-turn-helix domain-containing protein [Chryseobacterium sp.]